MGPKGPPVNPPKARAAPTGNRSAACSTSVSFNNAGDEREREIIAEINDDVLAYKTKYGNIIFCVYDLGFIRDVERFADAFEGCDGVIVRVVKHWRSGLTRYKKPPRLRVIWSCFKI